MLTEKQSDAMDRIIKGDTITDIARDTGCTRQTLYIWMKNEEWTAEMDHRVDVFTQAAKKRVLTLLTGQVDAYIGNLWDIASDRENAPTVRLQATQYAMKLLEGMPKEDNKASAAKDQDTKKEATKEFFTELKAVGQ